MNNDHLELLVKITENASIWRPNSVSDEPNTKLTQWQVFLIKADINHSDSIHFIGYAGFEGRVSSPIKSYDPVTRRGISRSGRIYELVGDSGYNGDTVYVFNRWLGILGAPDLVEISKEYESVDNELPK